METFDPVSEWNRLTDLYRQKSDDELELVAADAYDLTDTAQQVLAAEISLRKLDIKLNDQPPASEQEEEMGPVDQFDPSELDLRPVYSCDTNEELVAVKRALEQAGIAHFIGPNYVQELEDFHGSFEGGVRIYVRYVDQRRASSYLNEVFPQTHSKAEPEEEVEESAPTCPACHSDEIVFLSQDPKDDSKFRWRFDACGNRWTNDGVFQ